MKLTNSKLSNHQIIILLSQLQIHPESLHIIDLKMWHYTIQPIQPTQRVISYNNLYAYINNEIKQKIMRIIYDQIVETKI
jgi:hypothetical protein